MVLRKLAMRAHLINPSSYVIKDGLDRGGKNKKKKNCDGTGYEMCELER